MGEDTPSLWNRLWETPSYKEYCGSRAYPRGKDKLEFYQLALHNMFTHLHNLRCDNVQRKLDVSLVLLSTRRHWTVDWSTVRAIALLLLMPRLDHKKITSLLMQQWLEMLAWIITSLGISENRPRVQGDKTVSLNRRVL